jgi:hypothetical protein
MNLGKITVATTLALATAVLAVGSASAGGTAGKPGLTAGTWTGTGMISGSVTDAAGTTTFTGKVGFRISVAKDRWAKGTGSWVRTMKGGTEFTRGTLRGIAQLRFAGPSNEIDILYAEDVEGTITLPGGKTTPMKFKRGWDDQPLQAALVVKQVKRCSASGTIPAGDGIQITWTAKAQGCKR